MESLKPSPESAAPERLSARRVGSWRRWLVSVGLCTLVLGLSVCLLGKMRSGSLDTFVQRANGEELVVGFDPPDLTKPGALQKYGHGKSLVHIPIMITNFADVTHTIIGGTTDCHCVTTGQLPQSISPRTKGSIDISIVLDAGESSFDHVVTLYTDSPVNAVLTFRVVSAGH
jgi:hypothetical protein